MESSTFLFFYNPNIKSLFILYLGLGVNNLYLKIKIFYFKIIDCLNIYYITSFVIY